MSNSRVEQEAQARQAAEAERLNKRIERESRDAKASEANREAFAKLVKTSERGQTETKDKGERAQAEAKQGEQQAGQAAKQSTEAERNARMARGGVMHQSRLMEQAKSFQGVLQNQQAQTTDADKGRVERRDDGKAKDRVERDDRAQDIQKQETKRDTEAELARVEARENARPNAAIEAGCGDGDGNQEQGGEDRSIQAAKAAQAAGVDAAKGAAPAREVKQIPPELLDKLVSAVWIGVNQKGLKEFQMELKDGPFKGAHVKITNDGGRVSLRFDGLDGDNKRLLEASKGELMRRLEAKGLTLSRLDVR